MTTAVEHLSANLLCLSVLFLFDRLVLCRLVVQAPTPPPGTAGAGPGAKPKAEQLDGVTRWFFLHAFANAIVVLTCLNSVWCTLSDPLYAMDSRVFGDESLFGNASRWPLTMINSVHLYHMVGGFQLTAADYFHHMLFIPTLGLSGQLLPWGALRNWQAFFISGLPGGIDYFLLGLMKLQPEISKVLQKRVSANMNVWCRCPGILVANILCYQATLYGNSYGVPWWAIAVQMVLPPYNAIYYCKQSVANYAVHYMLTILGQDKIIKDRINTRTSITIGSEIMNWKDALVVPQRGS